MPSTRTANRPSKLLDGAVGVTTPRSVNEIFEVLRDAVVSQSLSPGVQLKEQPLASAFGVNRAAIRQVLAKLANCKLAVHRLNRGVFVASPSREEAVSIFHARRVVETAIIELAVERMDAHGLRELRTIIAQEQAGYLSGKLREASKLSVQFHRTLAQKAGNSVLEQFLEEIVARTPLVVLSFNVTDNLGCEGGEHAKIVDAIEARDAALAVRLLHEHLGHLENKLAFDEHLQPDELERAIFHSLGSAND